MRLLGISGSLRRGSRNTQLLREATTIAPEEIELVLYQGLDELPAYDPDLDAKQPPAVAGRLRAAISGSDALLIATPEYNGSIPGPLKNAVDWASRPFPANALHNKPVAVIGATTGRFGGVWAQAELRKVLAVAGARVVEAELAIGAADAAFDEDGRLCDAEVARQLAEVLDLIAREVARSRGTDTRSAPGLQAA